MARSKAGSPARMVATPPGKRRRSAASHARSRTVRSVPSSRRISLCLLSCRGPRRSDGSPGSVRPLLPGAAPEKDAKERLRRPPRRWWTARHGRQPHRVGRRRAADERPPQVRERQSPGAVVLPTEPRDRVPPVKRSHRSPVRGLTRRGVPGDVKDADREPRRSSRPSVNAASTLGRAPPPTRGRPGARPVRA